jgi:hypothetical protein
MVRWRIVKPVTLCPLRSSWRCPHPVGFARHLLPRRRWRRPGHFDRPNLVSLCRVNGKLWLALACHLLCRNVTGQQHFHRRNCVCYLKVTRRAFGLALGISRIFPGIPLPLYVCVGDLGHCRSVSKFGPWTRARPVLLFRLSSARKETAVAIFDTDDGQWVAINPAQIVRITVVEPDRTLISLPNDQSVSIAMSLEKVVVRLTDPRVGRVPASTQG